MENGHLQMEAAMKVLLIMINHRVLEYGHLLMEIKLKGSIHRLKKLV